MTVATAESNPSAGNDDESDHREYLDRNGHMADSLATGRMAA
jgi:hypothetical protein